MRKVVVFDRMIEDGLYVTGELRRVVLEEAGEV